MVATSSLRDIMAEQENGHVTLDAQEARQGKKLGVMRYVLAISLGLSLLAGVIIYASFSH